jgi:hypothetical protein
MIREFFSRNAVIGLEWGKEPKSNEPLVTTPPLCRCSGHTGCIASAIQPPALSVLPTGTGCVAAV